MTEDTGAGGDMNLDAERRVEQMGKGCSRTRVLPSTPTRESPASYREAPSQPARRS